MRHIRLLGFFVLTVAFVACGQFSQKDSKTEEVKTEIPENWKELNESGYSIQYPDTFYLDKPSQFGMKFILLSKQTSLQDMFRENVNLVIQDLAGLNIDFDKYIEISEEQIKSVITDINQFESQRLTNKNTEFQRLIYTGKQGSFNLKWQQLCWVVNEKAYVLTLTCEQSQYDNYVSVGEEIMKSFIIK